MTLKSFSVAFDLLRGELFARGLLRRFVQAYFFFFSRTFCGKQEKRGVSMLYAEGKLGRGLRFGPLFKRFWNFKFFALMRAIYPLLSKYLESFWKVKIDIVASSPPRPASRSPALSLPRLSVAAWRFLL
jgi:hypothetical protein